MCQLFIWNFPISSTSLLPVNILELHPFWILNTVSTWTYSRRYRIFLFVSLSRFFLVILNFPFQIVHCFFAQFNYLHLKMTLLLSLNLNRVQPLDLTLTIHSLTSTNNLSTSFTICFNLLPVVNKIIPEICLISRLSLQGEIIRAIYAY